jgi:hypothetical protein
MEHIRISFPSGGILHGFGHEDRRYEVGSVLQDAYARVVEAAIEEDYGCSAELTYASTVAPQVWVHYDPESEREGWVDERERERVAREVLELLERLRHDLASITGFGYEPC